MFIQEDDLKLKDWQFSQRKYLPWDTKLRLSEIRIREWHENWGGQVYLSYSGGLDSTVLLHMIRSHIGDRIPAVFCNTGLEFPEIVHFARKAGKEGEFIEIHPRDRSGRRITYKQVIQQYGYPLIGKETAEKIYKLRKGNLSERYRHYLLYGDERGKLGKLADKWQYLVDAPFDISSKCCEAMKKRPFHWFVKETGRVPYIATTQDEGFRRAHQYAHTGCNVYDGKTIKSQPLGFWTKQDILRYVVENNLEICSVYGDILQKGDGTYYLTGEQRTGCMYCAMGAHLEQEPNRFQRMAKTHPECYDFCMRNTKIVRRSDGRLVSLSGTGTVWNWEIERDIARKIQKCGVQDFYREYQVKSGLGMAQILEYAGIAHTTWEAQGQMSLGDYMQTLSETA